MYVSIFELFKIGVGPSSSHTMGPMYAAVKFVDIIEKKFKDKPIKNIDIKLYGSLAYTGRGHKTYEAICLGLNRMKPDKLTNDIKLKILNQIKSANTICILNNNIDFVIDKNIKAIKKNEYPSHPNPLLFTCTFNDNTKYDKVFYSIGGGFIHYKDNHIKSTEMKYKYNFKSFDELKSICKKNSLKIYDIILENEYLNNNKTQVNKNILNIWYTMNKIINNGINSSGTIDDILKVDNNPSFILKFF